MTNPLGVPIPLRPRLDRRDSGVTAAVWGKEKYLTNPQGVPIPPRPGLDRRDSGVTAAVWGKEKISDEPTGRPYPSAAQAGPEGLGCNRRCVGVERVVCPQSYTGRPYPPSLHQAETGRRPRVALAAAVGISRCHGWLGGGGPNPFLSLSSSLPLFHFFSTYSDRPPQVGFLAWGARGGLPLFHISLKIDTATLPGSGRGGGPPLISAKHIKATGPGGLPLYHSIPP